MTDALSRVLNHLGYEHRAEQDTLYSALGDNEDVLFAQAGTGTGKSIAVLSAAVDSARAYGLPSLVVVPTNILMNQYVTKDAPAVEDSLGVDIRALKGRSHYLCASAPSMRHGGEREPEYRAHLLDNDRGYEVDTPEYGCPGSDECRYSAEDPGEWPCQYQVARQALAKADVIITNAHLFHIDIHLKKMMGAIFPDYGAVFVDEAHTLEDVIRGFTSSTIGQKIVRDMGYGGAPMADLLDRWRADTNEPVGVWGPMIGSLIPALQRIASWQPETPGARPSQRQWDAINAAQAILNDGQAGSFDNGERVLWFDPGAFPAYPKLISTQINLAPILNIMLSRDFPTALVSATIPVSTPGAYGVGSAKFIDVGHPFDYSKQAKLGVSRHSGSWKESGSTANVRAAELLELVGSVDGGVLLLFSSFKDLIWVHRQIGRQITRMGRNTYLQESGVNRDELAAAFKADGRGVLFGSESFATGFDAPGSALQAVGVWKLPYPGLDPVTRAIQRANFQRYEDTMRMKLVQAVGRLIRTPEDVGRVWIADARALRLMRQPDRMTAHLGDFGVLSAPGAAKSSSLVQAPM